MSESSCGKLCEACPHRRAGDCPGCAEKPGRDGTGACGLARARRERGEQACSACSLRVVCCAPCSPDRSWVVETGALAVRHPAPPQPPGQPALSPELLRLCRAAAPLLWLLFALTAAPFALSLSLPALLSAALPQAAGPVNTGLSLLCRAAAAVVLFLLSREESGYRASAVCDTVSLAFRSVCLALALPDVPAQAAELAETILLLVSFCIQCRANLRLAGRADPGLAGKWGKLRRWTLAALLAPAASLLLLGLSLLLELVFGWSPSASLGVLAVLLSLFSLAAALVVPIVFLVLLGQTASRLASLARGAEPKAPGGADGP